MTFHLNVLTERREISIICAAEVTGTQLALKVSENHKIKNAFYAVSRKPREQTPPNCSYKDHFVSGQCSFVLLLQVSSSLKMFYSNFLGDDGDL